MTTTFSLHSSELVGWEYYMKRGDKHYFRHPFQGRFIIETPVELGLDYGEVVELTWG